MEGSIPLGSQMAAHGSMSSSSGHPPSSKPSVSSSIGSKSSQKRKGRTKVLYFWSCEDVNKWLRKHCGQYHQMYTETFTHHDINGRALVRLNDNKLQRMGIMDAQHREDLLRHVLRLKLKTESQELKTLEQRGGIGFEVK